MSEFCIRNPLLYTKLTAVITFSTPLSIQQSSILTITFVLSIIHFELTAAQSVVPRLRLLPRMMTVLLQGKLFARITPILLPIIPISDLLTQSSQFLWLVIDSNFHTFRLTVVIRLGCFRFQSHLQSN